MPSAEKRKMPTTNANINPLPIRGPEFNINSQDVEGLVVELKEHLRLPASTMRAPSSCHHLTRRCPSRASPYHVPNRITCENNSCEFHRKKCNNGDTADDPYELLQKLIRDGGLVTEAVRRLEERVTAKMGYSYETDEETSPSPPQWYSAEN